MHPRQSSTMDFDVNPRSMSKRPSYMDVERTMSKRPSYMDVERTMSKRPSFMDVEHQSPMFGRSNQGSNPRSNPRSGGGNTNFFGGMNSGNPRQGNNFQNPMGGRNSRQGNFFGNSSGQHVNPRAGQHHSGRHRKIKISLKFRTIGERPQLYNWIR